VFNFHQIGKIIPLCSCCWWKYPILFSYSLQWRRTSWPLCRLFRLMSENHAIFAIIRNHLTHSAHLIDVYRTTVLCNILCFSTWVACISIKLLWQNLSHHIKIFFSCILLFVLCCVWQITVTDWLIFRLLSCCLRSFCLNLPPSYDIIADFRFCRGGSLQVWLWKLLLSKTSVKR